MPPSSRSTWTTVDGLRIHARVSGTRRNPAPPVVLVHGLGVSGRYFARLQALLGDDVYALAPDLPGSGRSDTPRDVLDVPQLAYALGRWMEASGTGRAALLGNSMGCQVIAELAVQRPDLVERAVLSGPTMDAHARHAVWMFLRLLLDVPHEQPSMVALALHDYVKTGPLRTLWTYRHALRDRIETKLQHMAMPVMVVRGARDPIVSQRWAEELTTLLPDGHLRVLPGAPHSAHFSTPLQFARVVRPFLLAGRGTRDAKEW